MDSLTLNETMQDELAIEIRNLANQLGALNHLGYHIIIPHWIANWSQKRIEQRSHATNN